jgi:uncharacterized protein
LTVHECMESTSGVRPLLRIDGPELRRITEGSVSWLEGHIDSVNSLNVFPVPDGDTGTNMYLTMQAALREVSAVTDTSVSAIVQALAHGALMGARGNSGVILSQIWRGFAKHLTGSEFLSGKDLALALREGAATAYKGVMRPVEGTILTVVRQAAEAAVAAAQELGDLACVLGRAVAEAKNAVARTPQQLAVLKEAGVVDAGGQGLSVLLDGMLRALRGEDVTLSGAAKDAGANHEHVPTGEYGYDIQFLVVGQGLDIDGIREKLSAMGDSLLVVGDSSTVKVHVHSHDPGPIVTYATTLGSLQDVVMEDMQLQYRQFLAAQAQKASSAAQPPGKIATVAVANGAGLCRVFESLGVSVIVQGGQTMNPSTEELLQAIANLPADKVILLPNNPNVILTAQQAQGISDKQVAVIPTKSIPQGIGALLAFNNDGDLHTNVDLMERAAAQIQTVEITRAVRSVHINGLKVEKGQIIGLLNGQLVRAGDDLRSVTEEVLQAIDIERYEVITIYWGSEVTKDHAEALAAWIREHHSGQEVEVVEGNQPYYQYIISAE